MNQVTGRKNGPRKSSSITGEPTRVGAERSRLGSRPSRMQIAAIEEYRSRPLNESNDGPWLLSVEEAARKLSLSRSKTYELVLAGDLPSITIGRSRRVPSDALRFWIDSRIGD